MCKFFHKSTREWSATMLTKLKRNYYVTPTSYLELITTFRTLLKENRENIKNGKLRYEIGLEKLITTEGSVAGMKEELTELQPKLVIAGEETNKKMAKVEIETIEAEKVHKEVGAEEAIAQVAADEAKTIKDECEGKLAEAMPILNEALSALRVLNKNDITNLKAMTSPPAGVRNVMEAVCILREVVPPKKMDPNTSQMVSDYWAASLKVLTDSNFLQGLLDFDKEHIPDKVIKQLQKFITMPNFTYKDMLNVSVAAAGLCSWCIAIEKYHHVNKIVAPM
jgi:dynein heavy chain